MLAENKRSFLIHLGLFLVTFITTTLAGAEWIYNKSLFFTNPRMSWEDFKGGMHFSIPFLFILTVHEFGHYTFARLYKAAVTLPYYIPFWLGFIGMPSIGTFGAIIRIKSPLQTRWQFYDVGIAGPLAGFVVALGVIWYGFTHLPPPEYIFTVHPEYAKYGLDYAQYVYKDTEAGSLFGIGTNLTFIFFKNFVVANPDWVPNPYELIHYPYLFAGYLALFFTSLNLLPIGQLDGGHVLYGLFGPERHAKISPALFMVFVLYVGMGMPEPLFFYDPNIADAMLSNAMYLGFLYFTFARTFALAKNTMLVSVCIFALQYFAVLVFPDFVGFNGWLLFAFIIGRFLGVYHPPALIEQPLDTKRIILGLIAILVFLVSFSPMPFIEN